MNDYSFKNRIKKIISLSGNADKLAHSAGVSPSLIGKYLSGKTDPTRKKLISLAEAAGVDVKWLATGEGLMRDSEWHELNPTLIITIIEILEDYRSELGEAFTSKKKNELIERLYESLSDNFPGSEKTKNKIKNTIIDIFDLLPTLERMVEKENDRKLAKKIIKSIFEKSLPEKEADQVAEELILTRLIKRCQK
jgi:transcriptional regulator with XRE-family HTH domain